MIKLFVKGSKKAATRSAQRHGVVVRHCRRHPGGTETVCEVACKPGGHLRVMRWFGERSLAKQGRGFPQGTLLHFSGECKS